MSFRAYDELDPQRLVLLNGHREFNIYPIACSLKPIEVIVDSSSPSKNIVMGSRRAKVNDKGKLNDVLIVSVAQWLAC